MPTQTQAFHHAAQSAALDKAERSMESAGRDGATQLRGGSLGADALAAERADVDAVIGGLRRRLQAATDGALAAHCQAMVARSGLAAAAALYHQTHAREHPRETRWLECTNVECEKLSAQWVAAMEVHPEPSRPVPAEVLAIIAGSLMARPDGAISNAVAVERAANLGCWWLWSHGELAAALARLLPFALPRPGDEIDPEKVEAAVERASALLAELGIGGGK